MDQKKVIFQHLRKTGGTTVRDMLWPFFKTERTAQPNDYFTDIPNIESAIAGLFDNDFIHGHYEMLTFAPPNSFTFSFFREPYQRLLSDRRQWMQASPADIAAMQPDRAEATVALKNKLLLEILPLMTEFPVIVSSFWNYQTLTLGAWPLIRQHSTRRGSSAFDNSPFYKHFESTLDMFKWLNDNSSKIMKQAKQSLNRLGYVGLQENFDHSIKEVFARIGLPEPAIIPFSNKRASFPDEADSSLRKYADEFLQLDYELYEAAAERHASFARAVRGAPANYIQRKLARTNPSLFLANEQPGGHGWHPAHKREDGNDSRWTDGSGASNFSFECDAGSFDLEIRFWGAASESTLLLMEVVIAGTMLISSKGHDSEG